MTDPGASRTAAAEAAAGQDHPLADGLAAFAARDLPRAHAAFERAHRRAARDPRASSWYGVTLVLVERNITLGISLCDEALRAAPNDPELLLNSARVHLALRQRERAARAITRGLTAWPCHPALLAARLALGTRRPPVIPFLTRDNPLNRLLGRLRHRWATRDQPARDQSPETLGRLPARPTRHPGAEPCPTARWPSTSSPSRCRSTPTRRRRCRSASWAPRGWCRRWPRPTW